MFQPHVPRTNHAAGSRGAGALRPEPSTPRRRHLPGLVAAASVLGGAGLADAAPDVRVAREPLFVELRVDSVPAALDATSPAQAELVAAFVAEVLDSVRAHPGRIVTLRLDGLPFDVEELSPQTRQALYDASGNAADWTDRYARAASDFTLRIIDGARAGGVDLVSVAGLPHESMRSAAWINERYASVIDGIDAFVTPRSFIISQSTDERALVRFGMAQAIALASGRPILYRANRTWRMLIDPVLAEHELWRAQLVATLDALTDRLDESPEIYAEPTADMTLLASDGGLNVILVPDSDRSSGGAPGSTAGGSAGAGSGAAGGGGGSGGGGGGGSAGGGGGSSGGGGTSTAGGGGGSSGGGGGGSGGGGGGLGGGGGSSGGGGGGGSSGSSGPNLLPPDPPPAPTRPLVLSTVMSEEEIGTVYAGVVDRRLFPGGLWPDPANPFDFDRARLEAHIEQSIPDNREIWVFLDWEGPALRALKAGPSDPNWQEAHDNFLAALQFFRQRRPHAKLGYYSIPVPNYWVFTLTQQEQDEYWRKQEALSDIIEASDFLLPGIYDSYGTNHARDELVTRRYITGVLRLSGGKPVYPFSWHRYHPGNQVLGYQVIDNRQYYAHLRAALAAEFEGDMADGLVSWGSEKSDLYHAYLTNPNGTYVNNTAFWIMVRRAFSYERLPGETDEEFVHRIYDRVFCLMTAVVDDERQRCEPEPSYGN